MDTVVTSDRLKSEIETFERCRQDLLATDQGRFVVIHGADVVGIWDSYADALKVGYEKYGVTKPFLVRRISGPEGIQHFSRDLA